MNELGKETPQVLVSWDTVTSLGQTGFLSPNTPVWGAASLSWASCASAAKEPEVSNIFSSNFHLQWPSVMGLKNFNCVFLCSVFSALGHMWKVEVSCGESVLSFHSVATRDPTELVRFESWHLCLVNHRTQPTAAMILDTRHTNTTSVLS